MLHFVNDLLDYGLIKQQKFKKNLTKFDPNITINNVILMFQNQSLLNRVKLIFQVEDFLESPVENGGRTQ